jgi:hypothetical protein
MYIHICIGKRLLLFMSYLHMYGLNFKPTIETNFNGQKWTFLIHYTTICYFLHVSEGKLRLKLIHKIHPRYSRCFYVLLNAGANPTTFIFTATTPAL